MIFTRNIDKRLIKEEMENGELYVYHGTHYNSLEGIMEVGFERVFTATNGGNMYGPGVYTTFKLARGYQNANGTYGDVIIKAKVKSIRNFISYVPEFAEKIYGKDNVSKSGPLYDNYSGNAIRDNNGNTLIEPYPDIDAQLRKILPKDMYDEIRHSRYIDYDKVTNTRHAYYSSRSAVSFAIALKEYHPRVYYQINGFFFFGENDGYVCLLSDFKNLYPVAYTKDGGKTFLPINMEEEMKNDIDLRHQLGKHNYELLNSLDFCPFNFTHNFARIIKNGKCNFLYKKKSLKDGPISPVWFTEAPETFNRKGTCVVSLGQNKLILQLDSKTNEFYVYDYDGDYLCNLKDLGAYVDENTNSLVTFDINDTDDDF